MDSIQHPREHADWRLNHYTTKTYLYINYTMQFFLRTKCILAFRLAFLWVGSLSLQLQQNVRERQCFYARNAS